MNSKKTTKTFKEYYQDPVFRERHKKYLLTKIECPECGCVTSRCNMSHHKKTEKHKRLSRIKKVNNNKNEIESLKKQLSWLEEKINSLNDT